MFKCYIKGFQISTNISRLSSFFTNEAHSNVYTINRLVYSYRLIFRGVERVGKGEGQKHGEACSPSIHFQLICHNDLQGRRDGREGGGPETGRSSPPTHF
jgi:hypothetical protein